MDSIGPQWYPKKVLLNSWQTDFKIDFFSSTGNQTLGLTQTTQVLCHWATSTVLPKQYLKGDKDEGITWCDIKIFYKTKIIETLQDWDNEKQIN